MHGKEDNLHKKHTMYCITLIWNIKKFEVGQSHSGFLAKKTHSYFPRNKNIFFQIFSDREKSSKMDEKEREEVTNAQKKETHAKRHMGYSTQTLLPFLFFFSPNN